MAPKSQDTPKENEGMGLAPAKSRPAFSCSKSSHLLLAQGWTH